MLSTLTSAKVMTSVETGVLLHKLKEANVTGKIGVWIAAFLNSYHRKQAVSVEGVMSALSPVI